MQLTILYSVFSLMTGSSWGRWEEETATAGTAETVSKRTKETMFLTAKKNYNVRDLHLFLAYTFSFSIVVMESKRLAPPSHTLWVKVLWWCTEEILDWERFYIIHSTCIHVHVFKICSVGKMNLILIPFVCARAKSLRKARFGHCGSLGWY